MENNDPLHNDSPEAGPFREYANNVYFNSSIWDMTLVFGQLASQNREPQTPAVDFHTAITVPWQQAKLMAYYLFANVVAYEATNGSIRIPAELIPKAELATKGQALFAQGDTEPPK